MTTLASLVAIATLILFNPSSVKHVNPCIRTKTLVLALMVSALRWYRFQIVYIDASLNLKVCMLNGQFLSQSNKIFGHAAMAYVSLPLTATLQSCMLYQ